MKWLKYIRVLFAVAAIVIISYSLVDFTGVLPAYTGWLEKIQLVPAVLAHATVVVVGIIIFTLLFGRVYCSVICPLGVFMDICSWVAKKSSKKLRYYRWIRPYNLLRYSILAACIITLFFGIYALVSAVDPYRVYHWASANILQVMSGGKVFNSDMVLATVAVIISLLYALVIVLPAVLWGRILCNTVCPVGALLGIAGKYSVCRVRIDNLKCTSCGECEKKCKATCISSKMKYVDSSRCVACYNCIGVCNYDALSYCPGRKDKQGKK